MKEMKDFIIFIFLSAGLLSITYLGIFICLGVAIFIKEIAGTGTQSGTGEIFQFMVNNPWTLIVSLVFSSIFISWKIIHEKNKRRRKKEKKYDGSLIGKPLP